MGTTKTPPRISDTEWELMRILWRRAPRPADEIITELQAADPEWHPKTAKTLLNRLVRKKALGFRKEGRAYLYRPLLTEEECVGHQTESFLERVFGGSLTPMIAHIVRQKRLSSSEIKELKRLLSQPPAP